MNSNLVSWNVPNMVTVNLMAWAGILVGIVIWQAVKSRGASASTASNNSGGY